MFLVNLFMGPSAQSEFEHLVSPHVDHLYHLAYRFTNNTHDAEDLVQDLLIKLFPRLPEIRDIERLRPWLDRVLYRLFIDRLRQNQRRPALDGDEIDPDELARSDNDPELDLEQNLTQERLQTAYSKLNEDHRALLAMHDIEGYTLLELESMLDAPIGTLKSRLHRARKQLRKNLA
jgi:RNA polymerase sigma-70 factor (ECF subfamily)